MKKRWLAAAIGAFACSFTLGAAMLLKPAAPAGAANDQLLFEDKFSSSAIDGSVWSTTGDVAWAPAEGAPEWNLGGNAKYENGVATLSGGSYIYLPVSNNYTMTFTKARGTTGATALDVNQSLLMGINVAGASDYLKGTWFASSIDNNSNLWVNAKNVTTTYTSNSWFGQDGAFTLTVSNGTATLINTAHNNGYLNFPIGTSGYVSFYVPEGASASTISNITYQSNETTISDGQMLFGEEGGTLVSKPMFPGLDNRLGWEGAMELIFVPKLAGLGTATFTVSIGDWTIKVTPDGGRYLLSFFDGDTERALSAGNTNPAFVVSDSSTFYATVRQNGGFSVSYNGVGYTVDGAMNTSPYGEVKFSVTDGSDGTVAIDQVKIMGDEFDVGTVAGEVTATGFDGWTKSGNATKSGNTATMSAGARIVFNEKLSGNYTLTFDIERPASGGTALGAYSCGAFVGLNVPSASTAVTSGQWLAFYDGAQGGVFSDAHDVNGSSGHVNNWCCQNGTNIITVSGGVATWKHAQHGVAYNNIVLTNASGYLVIDAGANITISNVSVKYTAQVEDNSTVYHTFEDENGVMYYASNQTSKDATIALSTVAPTYGPKKAGYTFKNWTKDGVAVSATLDNTASAVYKPTYYLGELEYVSATLEGDIGLNFYMTLPSVVKSDATAKVVFTIDGEAQEYPVNATGKYTARVAAQDYDKDVVMTISTTAGEALSYTYSVKEYIETILVSEDASLASVKPLVTAMQNYCVAAQEYFTEADGVTEAYLDVTKETLAPYKTVVVSKQTQEDKDLGIEIFGMTAVLDSKTSLRVWFTAPENTAACSVKDDAGVTVANSRVGSQAGEGRTLYYVEVYDIAAQDLDKAFTFSIGSFSAKVSVLSYIYSDLTYYEVSQKQLTTANLNLLRAIYLYNQAADAYFAPKAEEVTTVASYWDDDSALIGTQAGQFDFVLALNGEENRDARILQLTDIQIIDSAQERANPQWPLNDASKNYWLPTKTYENAFKYMREAVANANPDLIVLTGDNTYGRFDDNGTMVQAIVREMDSYGIPWTFIWGNHDLETYKGIDWVVAQYRASKYCRFSTTDGGITGSGNFTVGITQNGQVKSVAFCVDSNGQTVVTADHPDYGSSQDKVLYTTEGVQADQINWIKAELTAIQAKYGNVQSIGFMHHVLYGQKMGLVENHGYAPTKQGALTQAEGAIPALSGNGDFGAINYEAYWTDTDLALHNASKTGAGIAGWFCGHEHLNSCSVMYDGVRYTNGLKVGTYDAFNAANVGGTLIKMNNGMAIEHLYTSYVAAYPAG